MFTDTSGTVESMHIAAAVMQKWVIARGPIRVVESSVPKLCSLFLSFLIWSIRMYFSPAFLTIFILLLVRASMNSTGERV